MPSFADLTMKRQWHSIHGRASSESSNPRTKLSKKPTKPDGRSLFQSSNLRRASSSPAVVEPLQDRYEYILNTIHHTEADVVRSLEKLRNLILTEGLPDNTKSPLTAHSIRSRTWKRLLALYHISASEYISLVQRADAALYSKIKNELYSKIRNDTFRTLATDKEFLGKVDEKMLIRVLIAYAWKAELSSKSPSAGSQALEFTYVQGMNVLVAPFLYTMPCEVDAFFAFSTFIQHNCPLYVQRCLEGVHCGLKLVDICLSVADPELFDYLKQKNLTAKLYAFPSVLTFSACTPPLDQLLKLWDFLLAFGVHMNILCVVAQVLLIRREVLTSPSPMKLLRTFPPLDATAILYHVKSLVKILPENLYDLLARHPFDPNVVDELHAQVGAGDSL